MSEYLDKVAQEAFADEMKKIKASEIEKKAGIASEMLSGLNPLNALAALPAGIVAAITPTFNEEQMAKSEDSDISNLLIPGIGQYRYWKRLGVGNRAMKEALAEKIVSERAME